MTPRPSDPRPEVSHPITFYHIWHTGAITFGLVLVSMVFHVLIAATGLTGAGKISDSPAGRAAQAAAQAAVENVRRASHASMRRRSSHDMWSQAAQDAMIRASQAHEAAQGGDGGEGGAPPRRRTSKTAADLDHLSC